MTVPMTSAIARPSATAPSVEPVALRNAGLTMTRGIASRMRLGLGTNGGGNSRTTISHTPSKARPAIRRGSRTPDRLLSAAGVTAIGTVVSVMLIPPAREVMFEGAAEPHQADAGHADDQDRGE